MKKLFLTIVLALLFMMPAFAGSDHGESPGVSSGGGSSCGCTYVQQMQAKLAYQLQELAEYGPGSYYQGASQRTLQHLNAGIAAAAAGNPTPPLTTARGNQINPSSWSLRMN